MWDGEGYARTNFIEEVEVGFVWKVLEVEVVVSCNGRGR